jgi:hypothetical protein
VGYLWNNVYFSEAVILYTSSSICRHLIPCFCSSDSTNVELLPHRFLCHEGRPIDCKDDGPKEIQRAEIQAGQVVHLPPPEEVEEVPKLCTA